MKRRKFLRLLGFSDAVTPEIKPEISGIPDLSGYETSSATCCSTETAVPDLSDLDNESSLICKSSAEYDKKFLKKKFVG